MPGRGEYENGEADRKRDELLKHRLEGSDPPDDARDRFSDAKELEQEIANMTELDFYAMSVPVEEYISLAGSMFGLAVGDALGTALEFKKPGTFEPIDDMIGGGPFQPRTGTMDR